jgi:23S rRNA A2030 N6-methylase RlmJ
MANRHFGKLADVWKHGALLAVLDRERPARYAETHAGSGTYPLPQDAVSKSTVPASESFDGGF